MNVQTSQSSPVVNVMPPPPHMPLQAEESSDSSQQHPIPRDIHTNRPGDNRSDNNPPPSLSPSSLMPLPASTDSTTTPLTSTSFTTNIRPYSASGVSSPPPGLEAQATTRLLSGPSISTRTSFTRVETEDEEARLTPFPARPATASAAAPSSSSSSAGFGGYSFAGIAHGFGFAGFGYSEGPRLMDVVSTGASAEDDHDDQDVVEEQERERDQVRQEKTNEEASSSSPSSTQPLPSPPVQITMEHQDSTLAATTTTPVVPQDPQAYITFLHVSGRRRTMCFEPETTVGRVKELVWNTWPEDEEWQRDRPPAPSYLRLLYLGRLLQDDDTLTKLKIPTSHPTFPQPTILHLSIRPSAPPVNGTENNDNLNKKARLRRSRSRSGSGDDADEVHSNCCQCIIC